MNARDIKQVSYSSIDGLLDELLSHIDDKHEEFESVKLYGNGNIMLGLLKHILTSKFVNLKIGTVNFSTTGYDTFCKDEYSFEISEDRTICIQSAWNDSEPFLNEAKFAMVVGCSPEIVENIMKENSEFVVANLMTYF